MEPATKQCPFCAETILAAAVVCRYCGRDISAPRRLTTPTGPRCSVCQESVPAGAANCDHCHAVFTNAPTPAAPAKPKKKDLPGPVIVLIVAAVLVPLWLFGTLFPSKPSAPAAPAAPDKFGAFVICEQFVKDRLKAPATAVFPASVDTQTDQLSTVQFRNRAYVDSQNGFGANIRTHYTCTVTNTGGDNWHLDDLTTDP